MINNSVELLFNESKKPLILDGAMGSLIQQKGFMPDKYLWMSYLNFRNPEIITKIHEDYIAAGCDIITTNTFRTNPISIKKAGYHLDTERAVKQSVLLSKKVAQENNVLLAGSNAPAEDCYQAERTISSSEILYNHEKHIELLFSNGSDFILNETQSHFDEIKIICKHCSKYNIPFIISLFVTKDLNILSGEKLHDIIQFINEYNPILISFNCISEEIYSRIVAEIELTFNWGFYLNCGSGDVTDSVISCGLDENRYAEIVKTSMQYFPKMIGACCGSNPNHIREIKKTLNFSFD